MGKTISFSIAAYNIEKTIHKCIESILEAGCNDCLEILVVDDGSSDKTADIAKEYEKRYPDTVRLISKENGGHGSTINTGIREAKGKYFRAIDGDDWVNSADTTEYIRRLKSEDADIILCNYENIFDGNRVVSSRYDKLEDNKKYSFDNIVKHGYWMNYHSVTFKTEILRKNNIVLDEHCFYVDTELMTLSIPFVESISYFDLSVYCYRRDNEGQSISETSRKKNILHSKKVAIRLLRFLKTHEKSLNYDKQSYLRGGIAGHCMWHFRGLTFFAPDEEKRKDLIRFDKYVRKMSPEIYELMISPASNRSKGDAKIIRHIRKFNYKTFNIYGIYRKLKSETKSIIKTAKKRIAG